MLDENNLKETKVEVTIGCLDGCISRYERRQIKVAIAKLLSKQNLSTNPRSESLFIDGRPETLRTSESYS